MGESWRARDGGRWARGKGRRGWEVGLGWWTLGEGRRALGG